ncbi:hypothetical protein HKD37_12G034012 [Glycine soja]
MNPSREEHVAPVKPNTIGFYVQGDNCIDLVALGKIYDEGSTIHCMAYADDVDRVNVEKVFDGDTKVLLPTSEIQHVRQALDKFIAWPTYLMKLVSHEDSHITTKKVAKPAQRSNNVVADDPLMELIRSVYDIYKKPVELLWDGTKFGIPNEHAFIFLTYSDVNEIISGDQCLIIVILQLWMMKVNFI